MTEPAIRVERQGDGTFSVVLIGPAATVRYDDLSEAEAERVAEALDLERVG